MSIQFKKLFHYLPFVSVLPFVALPAEGTLVTFDDWALKASADGDYGDFQLDTYVRIGFQQVVERDGVIALYGGNPAVVAGNRPLPPSDYIDSGTSVAEINVSFNVPVTEFSADVSVNLFSFRVSYFTYAPDGTLTESMTDWIRTYFRGDPEYERVSVVAPAGAYVGGFWFRMSDDGGFNELRMDNLSYTPVPEAVDTASLLVASLVLLGMLRPAMRRIRTANG